MAVVRGAATCHRPKPGAKPGVRFPEFCQVRCEWRYRLIWCRCWKHAWPAPMALVARRPQRSVLQKQWHARLRLPRPWTKVESRRRWPAPCMPILRWCCTSGNGWQRQSRAIGMRLRQHRAVIRARSTISVFCVPRLVTKPKRAAASSSRPPLTLAIRRQTRILRGCAVATAAQSSFLTSAWVRLRHLTHLRALATRTVCSPWSMQRGSGCACSWNMGQVVDHRTPTWT